jgi:hypothetical protein
MGEEAAARRRSRTGGLAVAAAIVLVAVAVAGVFGWRRELAARAIAGVVADAGFSPASVTVEEIGFERLVVADLVGGSDRDLVVRRLTVDYGPAGLIRRQIKQVEIDGISLRLRPAAMPPATKTRPSPTDPVAGAGGDSGWTIGSGRFSGLHVTVAGGDGGTLAAAAGQFAIDPDGDIVVTLVAPLEIATNARTTPLTVRIDPAALPLARVERNGDRIVRASVHLATGAVTFAGTEIPFAGGDAEIGFGESPSLDLRSLRIGGAGSTPLAAPLSIHGSAAAGPEELVFAAEVSAADGKANAQVTGAWKPKSGHGRAAVTLRPVRFAPGELLPADLAPDLRLPVSGVTGTVAADGSVSWGAGGFDGTLEVRVADAGFRLEKAVFSGIDGQIRFDRLVPLRTPPGQQLTAGRIETGVALTDARVRFRLDDGGLLRIEEARIEAFGGRLTQSDAVLDPATGRYRGVIVVEDIAVQSLIEALNIDGAEATGRIGGSIPLAFADGRLSVEAASLATPESGILRYAPAAIPAALRADSEGVSLALQALTNFHYQALRLTLNGRSGEEWTGLLHVAGHNPELMRGQPFVFNINVGGDVESAVMSGLLGLDLPERIERKLRRR